MKLMNGTRNVQRNSVELIGYYGGDTEHCMSAWTSTHRELTDERKGRMDKLLKMLAENGHHTPFEKSYLHFVVKCDTATHIQFLKHRIGVSVNAESARYKEFKEDNYYIPNDWPEDIKNELEVFTKLAFRKYHNVLLKLEERGYNRNRAKESARFYLPYSTQITLDVGFNFRSFMHFQGLRNKTDAQLEIQEVAKGMLELVRDTNQFNLSLEAFKL